ALSSALAAPDRKTSCRGEDRGHMDRQRSTTDAPRRKMGRGWNHLRRYEVAGGNFSVSICSDWDEMSVPTWSAGLIRKMACRAVLYCDDEAAASIHPNPVHRAHVRRKQGPDAICGSIQRRNPVAEV